MMTIFKYRVENLPSKLLSGIHQHGNTISHGGPPYPLPPVTPSEAPSSHDIIGGITSNDLSLPIHGASEGASSGSSSTMQSENLSTNGDDEGLVDHREENNGSAEGGFPCPRYPRCHKSFSRERDIKRHMDQVHDKKRHRCDECTKSFSRPDAVKRHKRDTHEKNK